MEDVHLTSEDCQKINAEARKMIFELLDEDLKQWFQHPDSVMWDFVSSDNIINLQIGSR